jgi:hypothetical protein
MNSCLLAALPLPSHFQKKNIRSRFDEQHIKNSACGVATTGISFVQYHQIKSNQIIMAQQFEQVVVKVDEFMAKYPTITFYGECVCHGNKHKN